MILAHTCMCCLLLPRNKDTILLLGRWIKLKFIKTQQYQGSFLPFPVIVEAKCGDLKESNTWILTLCIYVTGVEIVVQKIYNGSWMVGYGKQVGDMGGCAGKSAWHNCTCEKVFQPKCRCRWKWCHLMMSLLHILGVGIKGSTHEIQEFSSVIHSFGPFIWFSWLVSQLGHLGSHRYSNLATSVPLKEWNYSQTGKCSLFVWPYIPKVILGTFS